MNQENETLFPQDQPAEPPPTEAPQAGIEPLDETLEAPPVEAEGYSFTTFPHPEEELLTGQAAEQEIDGKPERNALTIHIQSWATPIVGVLMLVLGLAGGYFARPLIDPEPAPVAGASSAGDSSSSAAQQPQGPTSPGDREALMAALLPNVRHFRGNPSAPITMIEFSDFQ